MRTTPRTVASIVCVALLTLAGCGDGDPPKAAPFTPTGHVETSAPTPSASESASAAPRSTKAEASAFALEFWRALGEAEQTGDTRALEAASGDDCAGCWGAINSIQKLYASGGNTTGGGYSVEVQLVRKEKLQQWVVVVRATNQRQVVHYPDKPDDVAKKHSVTANMVVQLRDGTWRVTVLGGA